MPVKTRVNQAVFQTHRMRGLGARRQQRPPQRCTDVLCMLRHHRRQTVRCGAAARPRRRRSVAAADIVEHLDGICDYQPRLLAQLLEPRVRVWGAGRGSVRVCIGWGGGLVGEGVGKC